MVIGIRVILGFTGLAYGYSFGFALVAKRLVVCLCLVRSCGCCCLYFGWVISRV